MPTSAPGSKRPGSPGFAFAWRADEHGFTRVERSAEHGFRHSGRSAEHGFTRIERSAEHGFTLVELMIVLVVIGLTSAAVMLAMPDANGRLRDEAARFALRVKAAHDGAIVSARPVSVWVTPGGYGFDERRGGAWVPMEQPRVERWREGTSATLDARSRVTFDSTGMADRPLTVPLVRGRARARIIIDADGAVDVAS